MFVAYFIPHIDYSLIVVEIVLFNIHFELFHLVSAFHLEEQPAIVEETVFAALPA